MLRTAAVRSPRCRPGRRPRPGWSPWCLAPLLLLAGGCDLTSPHDPSLVTVVTDQAVYRAGEDAIVTVTNGTPNPIHFHPSGARIARAAGSGWERLEALWPALGISAVDLAPGQSAALHVPVGTPLPEPAAPGPIRPSPLQPGHEYRVEVDVQTAAGSVESLVRFHSRRFSVVSWEAGPQGAAEHGPLPKGGEG